MTNSAITLHEIKKSFGKKSVLNGVTGKIEPGKVVGLLGRNGEGKTTLLRILLDILAADSGDISISGLSPDGTGKIRFKVGYIPERPSFHDFLSVEAALQLRSRFFPSWDWNKSNQLAKDLELDLKTPIRGASKGTLAKTAWICATAHHARVVLLDEPTSGLDPLIRDAVLSHLVDEMMEDGKTILMASHRMEDVLAVLDEIWILNDGKIQNTFSMEELQQNAWRITGRLGAQELPESLSIADQQRNGDLVQWCVIDRSTLETIRAGSFLHSMEMEPLPMETAFKLLLRQKENLHVK